MSDGLTLEDLSTLAESVDLECKAAQGRNGNGEVPEDFWKSYSAMANGEGGVIWLGIQEKPRGVFQALGLVEIEKYARRFGITYITANRSVPICWPSIRYNRWWWMTRPCCEWKCRVHRARPNRYIWGVIRLAALICAGMRAITRQTMKQYAE